MLHPDTSHPCPWGSRRTFWEASKVWGLVPLAAAKLGFSLENLHPSWCPLLHQCHVLRIPSKRGKTTLDHLRVMRTTSRAGLKPAQSCEALQKALKDFQLS